MSRRGRSPRASSQRFLSGDVRLYYNRCVEDKKKRSREIPKVPSELSGVSLGGRTSLVQALCRSQKKNVPERFLRSRASSQGFLSGDVRLYCKRCVEAKKKTCQRDS